MKYIRMPVLFVLFILTIVFVSGCSFVNDREVAATVNDEKITVSEFDFYLQTIKGEMEQKAKQENVENFWETEIDGKKATEVAKEKALEAAVMNIVQLQKAKEMNISLDEEDKKEVTKRKNDYMKSVGGRENYNKNLKEMGLSDRILTDLLEDDIIIQKLMRKIIDENEDFNITDEDAKEYYNNNPKQFETGEQVRAKHILFSTVDEDGKPLPEEKIKKAKSLAKSILSRIKEGEDFDKLMEQYSEDPGLQNYPDGYTFAKNGQMAKEFEDAAFTLEPGEVSDIVETQFGYHIIKVEDKFTKMPFDSVKDYIKNMIINDKYLKLVKSWKDEADIDINQKVMDKLKIVEK